MLIHGLYIYIYIERERDSFISLFIHRVTDTSGIVKIFDVLFINIWVWFCFINLTITFTCLQIYKDAYIYIYIYIYILRYSFLHILPYVLFGCSQLIIISRHGHVFWFYSPVNKVNFSCVFDNWIAEWFLTSNIFFPYQFFFFFFVMGIYFIFLPLLLSSGWMFSWEIKQKKLALFIRILSKEILLVYFVNYMFLLFRFVRKMCWLIV